jgi:aspartyl-tRNA synthetase
MAYETVIGLEVHVELSTKTKIFCGCSTAFGAEPNAHTCPVCVGMPGTLPVLNRSVVEKALRAAVALNCRIGAQNIFDRKNYFYPDLPKNYQISQLYEPLCRDGYVDLDMGNYTRRVRIHEIHMEEDAGKLVHDAGSSLVDYNRCGVPLIEIVSEPDLRNADEVTVYLDKLREILTFLDVSDCKMEEGSMRADVNLSIREEGAEEYGTRTETKNMNSIKAISRAIAYEGARQIAFTDAGKNILQETRRWDDTTGENYAMRSKENAQDYRYFPEPDLVPVHVDSEWVRNVTSSMPELAPAKRERYTGEYGIANNIAAVLTSDVAYARLFENILAELAALVSPAQALAEHAREVANTVAGDIMYLASGAEGGADKAAKRIDAAKVAALINLIIMGKINRNTGKDVLEKVVREDADPIKYVEENDLAMIRDDNLVTKTAEQVIAENPESVADYKGGKEKAFGYLVGQTMRLLKGKASPTAVNAALHELLADESEGMLRCDKSPSLRAERNGASAYPYDGDDGVIASETAQAPKQSRDKMSVDCFVADASRNDFSQKHNTESSETPIPQRNTDLPQTETDLPPIVFSNRYRTVTCGELRRSDIGSEAKLAGWVHTIRNHGGIVFVDLRDRYGVTQVVVTDEQVNNLHKEMSISVTGKILLRDEETVNPNIETGEVELKAENIEILGYVNSQLPFEIENSTDTNEELRLKYRYLDLRNPKVRDKIILRAEVIKFLRAQMDSLGFTEIQTPILANSSPEGARDYLVPSRKYKGMFYALPQAPQQFKQLLMVSGFDKYYQIAPCFRDEDARLDRSPGEFYQLDFEMSYATQEDVFAVAERVMSETFRRFTDKPVSEPPYVRIPYKESMLRYGSDKPDLRNPIIIIDLSEFFAEVNFAQFKNQIVRAIRVPGAGTQPKSFFKSMEQYAISIGMKGLGYITVQDDGSYKGPIDKFMTDEQKSELKQICEGENQPLNPKDVLYFISDAPDKVAEFAGRIRAEAAKRLGIIDENRYEFCFIVDYPMYELNDETGKIDFTHNPFSMPQGEMDALLTKDPLDILAYQYDIVVNGVELSSGAVRNHRPDIMVKAFEIAGYTEEDVKEKFGAMYNAFGFGAPPHSGMAPGVDRIIMLLSGDENIREIIAFPLNSNARNLMLGAPGEVMEQQLRDVHIKIR